MGSGEVLPGDWVCESCNVNNFARRTRCIDCKKSKDAGLETEGDPEQGGGSAEVRDGDWTCSDELCQANNFARRQSCFKCKRNKDGSEDKFEFRNGDWSCSACGTHNFARRSACFQCRKQRPDSMDWTCRGCNMSNFARRTSCYGCQAPKSGDSNRYHSNNNNTPNLDNGGSNDQPRDRGSARGRSNPVRNGDWMCAGCNFHNFARRDTCKGCGEGKGEEQEVVQQETTSRRQQPGDWICESCSENNFARRKKCFSCQEPKLEQD